MHLSTILIITLTVIICNFAQATSRPKICQGLHIRNDLRSFEALRNCNIIDGPLTIALVQNHTHPFQPEDYERLSFPQLYEITEYLLFFRVQGLTSLSKLFPNLAVIRGRVLVKDYALIIYEMTQLQTIDLPRLSDILRGSIRIENNPNLCYASTINWPSICKHPIRAHFLNKNNRRCNNRCPDYCPSWISNDTSSLEQTKEEIEGDVNEFGTSLNGKKYYCWNSKDCHNMCQNTNGFGLALSLNGGGCCSRQCAGGCYIHERSDQCISCRSVFQEDKCVEQCDYSLYEYRGQCITKQSCITMAETTILQNQTGTSSGALMYQCSSPKTALESTKMLNLKPIRLASEKFGRCVAQCPSSYEEDPSNKNNCKPCDKGKCRKVCTPGEDKITSKRQYTISTVSSLKSVSGCNVINGSLEISNLKGAKNVIPDLKEAFQELEEISGFLKITRSPPITTLSFLSNLRVINGTDLDRKDYSLLIIDNPNLQELFMFNKSDTNDQKQLKIAEGKIFFHLNPKLCLYRIDNLKSYAQVRDWDDGDVSPLTNGDREACSTEKLRLEFVKSNSKMALISFENYALNMPDPRSLLYYLVNYKESPSGNVSMFDGRDGCNSRNDEWNTVEQPPASTRSSSNSSDVPALTQELAIAVKPATRYGLYVKTFTISAKASGAVSDIIYFVTAPDTPEMPRQAESQAFNSSAVYISWMSPAKPNGVVERYYITVTKFEDSFDVYEGTDVCMSTDGRKQITSLFPVDKSSSSTANLTGNQMNSDGDPGDNMTCSKPSPDTDLAKEVISFQDQMIEIVYIKQSCPTYIMASSAMVKNTKRRSIDFDKSNNTSSLGIKSTEQRMGLDAGRLINGLDIASTTMQGDGLTIGPTTTKASAISSLNASSTASALFYIEFNNDTKHIEANMTVNQTSQDLKFSAVITNLEHFSQYQITIAACHGRFDDPKSRPPNSYKQCGMEVQTYVWTKPIDSHDKVPKQSIIFYPANQTSEKNILTWKQPEQPNGKVLGYRVKYRQKINGSTEQWAHVCINITDYSKLPGLHLQNVAPGTYLLQIQSLSLFQLSQGESIWSETFEFTIIDDSISWIIVSVVVFLLLIILTASISSAVYYKKKNAGLVYASVNPDYIEYTPDEWEVDKDKIQIGKGIGKGSFGLVFKAIFTNDTGTQVPCAVKTVAPNATAKQRVDFLREASIMKQFDTYHVIKLFGVVSITTPVYVIMELMETDLKNYLRDLRDPDLKAKKQHVDGIYLKAAQIADGMAYLSSKKFVHRDLAARNCMVGSNQIVKIGDFGLSRDMFDQDYYRRDTQGCLPVRWMAPESLKDNLYTTASDVWSYGVVLWEIVTWCQHPYHGLSNDQVVKQVMKGNFTLQKPTNCPEKLHNIMQRCWRKSKDRPTFIEIVAELLPFTDDEMSESFYFKQQLKQTEGDNTANDEPNKDNPVPSKDQNNLTGVESYPLLSWPSTRANGITNGVNMN